MPTSLPNPTTAAESGPETRYAYKASLIGSAHEFELTETGLSWRVGGRSGLWPYGEIASVRLSFRPVSMQARRFRADIESAGGGRIAILSTTWQIGGFVKRNRPRSYSFDALPDALLP